MTGSDELSIRLRRAEFNRALAEQNLSAIGPLLAGNVVMVTGSDSAVISGRTAQLKAWKAEFASSSAIEYVRSPDKVTLSAVEPIALEQGQWHGTAKHAAQVIASGEYSAKWRKRDGSWVIVAEIFVTLS